jgi:hypothetical protein
MSLKNVQFLFKVIVCSMWNSMLVMWTFFFLLFVPYKMPLNFQISLRVCGTSFHILPIHFVDDPSSHYIIIVSGRNLRPCHSGTATLCSLTDGYECFRGACSLYSLCPEVWGYTLLWSVGSWLPDYTDHIPEHHHFLDIHCHENVHLMV